MNGVTTYYVYDGQTLIREMQQNAQGVLQSTATYLCGPRGPEYRRDDTQAEGTYTDASGTHPAGKTRWYVYDGLGSVVGEVDPSGNMTSSDTFDVYGAKRAGGTGTTTSRQGFVGSLGHVTDSETGLVYMRARYYDPSVGRFISEDPKGNGNNWFVYCNNNSINAVDPSGKDGEEIEEFDEEMQTLIEPILDLFDEGVGIKAQEAIAEKVGGWMNKQYERIFGKDALSDIVKEIDEDAAGADVDEVAAEVSGNDMVAAQEAMQAAGLGNVAAEGDEIDAVEL